MKQHITKEQWDELSRDKKIDFSGNIIRDLGAPFKPNIGQMIEYLGDDFEDCLFNTSGRITDDDGRLYWDWENLCNNLWQAVKHKIDKI